VKQHYFSNKGIYFGTELERQVGELVTNWIINIKDVSHDAAGMALRM
jgi:hypothetical protein